MNVEHIRNITLIGHGGSGKTSLGEAMLFAAGVTTRLGRVDEGNSLLDFDPEEIKRKISINLSLAHFAWAGKWFNLLDTPGYLDFAGEVHAALRVTDNALLVINATSGVEVGAEKYWEVAQKHNLPRLVFVNKMKVASELDLDELLADLRSTFGAAITPVQLPIGSGEKFEGVFDLLRGDLGSLPTDLKDKAAQAKENLMESIIETDEELLERYLGGEEIPIDALARALKNAILSGNLYPVLFGDALEGLGVKELLDFLAAFAPSPADMPPQKGTWNDEEVEVVADPSGPTTVFVFKTLTEAHLGELYFVRVYQGTLNPGTELLNANLGRVEKINQVYLLRGKERQERKEGLSAGMFGALVKLKETRTGHTLCAKERPVILPAIEFPHPLISEAIVPKSREDEEKLSEGLSRLRNEDPTFDYKYDPELQQTLIWGLGELHLDVIVSKLKEKFGVELETQRPKIPYREAIRKPAQAMGKYVKQTGGRGQYGIVYIRIEPLPRGKGFEFVDQIFGGAIPSGFIPSVEKGIRDAMRKGVLAGYPVVDVKVTLYDGKHHPVDSSNLAFEIAGSLAFKEAQKNAEPYLLEPIYEVEVVVPEEFMGDVIGDLNARRGKILGMDSRGKYQVIRAHVPLAELYKYASTLRSITKGRGTFTMKFSHYDEVPREIAAKVIEEAKKEEAEG